jgi:hypothetical protein
MLSREATTTNFIVFGLTNSIHLNKWILNWNKVLKLSSIWYITIHAILASFFFNNHVHIGGVMVSVPASSAVDHKFEPQLGQTKDYKICSCCFSAKHAALRRKNKDWLARNQNNVSEWSDMSTWVIEKKTCKNCMYCNISNRR